MTLAIMMEMAAEILSDRKACPSNDLHHIA
jgi:hypothetical protein